VNIQSHVSAILFHGLSSLLVALSLRLVRAESLIHALKVGQASIHKCLSVIGKLFVLSRRRGNGRVNFLSEDGEAFVAGAGAQYEEAGRNPLEEMTLAIPAIVA
jgi:hypothetical protein